MIQLDCVNIQDLVHFNELVNASWPGMLIELLDLNDL